MIRIWDGGAFHKILNFMRFRVITNILAAAKCGIDWPAAKSLSREQPVSSSRSNPSLIVAAASASANPVPLRAAGGTPALQRLC